MSCGCESKHLNAVDKVRRKQVSTLELPKPFEILCSCQHTFIMTFHEDQCPNCKMVYGVTPCSNTDAKNVVAVGINY
jgi:hypothetical protein